jgi:tRNA nucleotidyltransferase (CCA-adding enzyme)
MRMQFSFDYDIISLVNKVNSKIKVILEKLVSNGFKAYIVGGYVRDYLLGINSFDVDITTDAKPNEIVEIFGLGNNNNQYGSIRFKDSLYNYDITTFRREIRYEDRKPIEYEYIDSIEEDVLRRDFTVNSLYMDIDGNITDMCDGQVDLENKVLRCVGNIETKMTEDPLRILRAIRFASEYGFEIEEKLLNFIKQNKILLDTLSYNRIKEELDIIFKNDNKEVGINLIKELKLADVLELKIPDNVEITNSYLGIWAQLEFGEDYPFTKNELDMIEDIKKIVGYGIIDSIVLYEYGLFASMVAGEILDIPQSFISSIYKDMPIYNESDIDITGDEIMEHLGIEPSKKLSNIYKDLELHILNRTLENTNEELKKYLNNNWR